MVINYGSQAVLAEEVTISNLFWPKNKRNKTKTDNPANTSTAGTATAKKTPELAVPLPRILKIIAGRYHLRQRHHCAADGRDGFDCMP